jgi:AraC-like DNA-binding protein
VKLVTHLFVETCELGPGMEWSNDSPGWRIVRVDAGFLYWITQEGSCELNKGQTLVLGPGVQGTVRSSQIGPATLHHFHFQPESLVCLMSASERLLLEAFGQTARIRILPSDDAAALEFADLVHSSGPRTFFYRCRLLNLVAMIFGETLRDGPRPRTHVATTFTRLEEIIARIPDADLIQYSSERLAEMCGCSLRHFRRVFRKHFKTSIRARQTALRLEKARQMLSATDEKVLTVAHECGYRHMSFFNLLFKKRYGTTPSAWRLQNRGREEAEPLAADQTSERSMEERDEMITGWPRERRRPRLPSPHKPA